MDYIIEQTNSIKEVEQILIDYDEIFNPSLSSLIPNFHNYAEKLIKEGTIYVVRDESILGFIAFYVDDPESDTSFLTQMAVNPNVNKKGIGTALIEKCIEVSKEKGKKKIRLEVYKKNWRAIRLYEKNDFHLEEQGENWVYMIKNL